MTLLAAISYDRTDWPSKLAVESTYLMQARSLGEDFDLVYTRADFDRMLLDDLGNPEDLALVTGSGGRRITFDRPFPYALYLAPFVRLWPRQGCAGATALLLALVSIFAARTLERRIGPWGATWVAVLVFASVLFAYVFLATGDLFLFALTLFAFCLVARAASRRRRANGSLPEPGAGDADAFQQQRWLAVGALLAIPAATEPLYALLAVAALFAPPAADRRAARTALVFGFFAALLIQALVGWWSGGGLFGLGASSFRFTPETGFPLVDFTAGEWPQTVRRLAAFHWDGAPRFSWGLDPRLWWWDGVYLLAGRSIGLMPYFAPLLLLPVVGSFKGYRRPLALAAALWALGIVVVQPFNLYGGEGALANRFFLPVYGALWMMIAPASRRRGTNVRMAFAVLMASALAAPFLWRLWTAPRDYPIDRGRGYRHVTTLARRMLPYETSQRRMPGGDAAEHNGLMVKFLSERGWAETRRGRLMIDAGGPLELLVGSTQPLDFLRFDFGRDAPGEIGIAGGKLEERLLMAGGGISFRVEPSWRRRHPMWWTPQAQWLYCVTLELPEAGGKALAFEIQGEQFRPK